MPNLVYGYVHFAGHVGTCGVGSPAANLTGLPTPIAPTWPQLLNAQASIGVYPAGWAAMEMAWRLTSLRLSSDLVAGGGNLIPSPVITVMDATEKGQLSYHIGTAAGLMLALNQLNPGAGALYFPFHLTRTIAGGAAFNFANAQRPDFAIYSVNPAGPALNHFVIWECKGHANNAGPAPLAAALNQSLSVTNMTALPGGAVLPAPVAPLAYIASQVDTFHGDYRLLVTDPPGEMEAPLPLPSEVFRSFLTLFYSPFHEILRDANLRIGRRYDGRVFVTTEIIPNVKFGLDLSIYEAFEGKPQDFTRRILRAISSPYKNSNPHTIWVGQAGLSIELDE